MNRLRAPRRIFVLSLMLAFLSGCGDRPAERVGRQIDQATGEVAQKIEQATNGVSEKIDRAAGKVTQKVDQVVSTVEQEVATAGRKVAQAGDAITDTGITAQVKAAILAYPRLKSVNINVDTNGGVVFLTGFVDSPADRQRSGEIAAAVAGVKSVHNHLIVNPHDSLRLGA